MSSKSRLIQIVIQLFLFIATSGFSQEEPYVNVAFFEDFTGDQVNNSVWQVATWTEHGGPTSRERCYVEDGFLKMIFINDSEEGFLNAAIQTRNEFLFGKWEARLKPSHIPGILNSFYTIDWNNFADINSSSNGTKQEIDIEFLTYTFSDSSGKVHYAVHEHNKKSFETRPDISLDFNPSDDFHVWGFEITPEYVEWFVDDTPLKRYTYADGEVSITSPYQLKLNVWTSESWVNGPPIADVECEYLIDWIRFTPGVYSGIQNEQNKGSQLNVYPNPFKSRVYFEFHNPALSQQTELSILDINGRIVFEKVFKKGEIISWPGLVPGKKSVSPGIYMYKIGAQTGSEKLSGRILKLE